MFQKKKDKLFSDTPNVCGIADDILLAGFDADTRDHDKRLEEVWHRCKPNDLQRESYLGECASHYLVK